MKKSVLVTALALMLALGTLIGLAVHLDRTATPVNMAAAHPWGDSAAAQGLTVEYTRTFGDKLFWKTDFSVAEGAEDTRFAFRAQLPAVQSKGEISDPRDEWNLTRLCGMATVARLLTVGKDGHALVTLSFAADTPVKPSQAPEGFGLWDVPVTVEEWHVSGGVDYVRHPDVARARLVFPLDIEKQRVAALTETAEGDVLLVTAEDGQFVLRVLDGETCALLQELPLDRAEMRTVQPHMDYENVQIRAEENFTLITLGSRELLVLEKAEEGYRISLRSEIMELRFRYDPLVGDGEIKEWTWVKSGTMDAGSAYNPVQAGYMETMAVCYRDGKLALAYEPEHIESTVFLEVYGDGGLLYGALLENDLTLLQYSGSYFFSRPWAGPHLTMSWGE